MQAELKEEARTENVEESGQWTIPFNLSIESLDVITKACFQAKADTTPVSPESIYKVSGIHPRTTAPNMRFLASIGVLARSKIDKEYTLTSKGADYAKSLGIGDEAKAGEALRDLLSTSHVNDLLGYVNVQGTGITYESLFNHVKTLARTKVDERGEVSGPFKAGIRCLISLLARAGFVRQDILGQLSESTKPTQIIRKNPKVRGSAGIEKSLTINRPAAESYSRDEPETLPVNINITIEAKDPEAIKQVAELLRQLRSQSRPSPPTG